MKRVFDFIVSLFGIILLLPLLVIIGLLVKLHDGDPVIFKQRRVGRYGKPFMIYKYRSMSVLKEAEDGLFEPGRNQRITPVGRILRRSKLDELPQLFNVLKGDMSLVGPRPEVEKWVNEFPERWERILAVRPGITDNASLEFRDEEALLANSRIPEATYRDVVLPKKMELYEEYVTKRSLLYDVGLIFKTLHFIASR